MTFTGSCFLTTSCTGSSTMIFLIRVLCISIREKMSGNAILALMGSGVASGLIGVTAFMMALKTTSVNKANVIKSAYPILLSVLAWLIFGEYMNIWMFIGIALTVVGVVIVNRSDVGSKAKAAA